MSALPRPRPEIVILPPELHELASVLDGGNLPPDAVIFVAMLPDGKIVGRTSICPLLFIEGSFVAPEYRSTPLAARLIRALEHYMHDCGRSHTAALVRDDQPEVAGYLERFGYEKQPVSMWAKDLNKKKGG